MIYLNGDYRADHVQGYCGWSYQKNVFEVFNETVEGTREWVVLIPDGLSPLMDASRQERYNIGDLKCFSYYIVFI